MYHLGASIKDLGKKYFAINKIEDTKIIGKIIDLYLPSQNSKIGIKSQALYKIICTIL